MNIHLIAACGTGMGTLACLLKQEGHNVTGSDQNVYPPMSDFLRANQITLYEGYDPSHLEPVPDLVIIGNAVSRDNPEAAAALNIEGLEYLSMPQAVNRFIARDKKIILIAGTHGKTTTSSIMAHMLYSAGLDPSFMIGGILRDFDSSFRIGKGEYMVIEGDEYDTAFFDKGPKFMHYPPYISILTGIEFDHADIFRDVEQIKDAFKKFILQNNDHAHFIAADNSKHLDEVLADAAKAVVFYGSKADSSWQYAQFSQEKSCTSYQVTGPETSFEVTTQLPGHHNAMNALACIAAAKKIGISDQNIQKALQTFSGIKRRQEIRGVKNNITVMDDFAHHPTAVQETIRAVKPNFPKGRLIAVFEPRTNTSMRHFFQQQYPDSFKEADLVCICRPQVKKVIPQNEKFSTVNLVEDLEKRHIEAYHFESTDTVIEFLKTKARPYDVILVMSNGGFDNIHTRLLEAIA